MSIFSCNITYKKIKGDSEKSTYNNLVAHGFIDESYKILNDDFYKANNELNLLASNKLGKDVNLYQVENKIAVPNTEVFKEIDKVNTSKNNIVNKEGIDFVYSQNPELETIGSKEQYSEYLKTIFPDSKVKDIVYHGTDKQFERFDNSFKGKTTGLNNYTDGTKIDSTYAFFFTNNIDTTFQYSYLNRIEKLKSLEYLFESIINKDQITYNKLKDLHPEVRTLLIQKKQELTPENFENYIKDLFNSYRSINDDIGGAGFLNQLVNYNTLKNNITYLRNNRNNILKLKNDLPFNLNSYGEKTEFFYIDKQGIISSSNLNYNKKNIKEFSSLEYDNLIKLLENRYENSFSKVKELIKKAKFTPVTYPVILNLNNYKEKDFQGATFVDQFTEQGANYEASKLTEQAYNENKDGVIFRNIKDPILSNNYGVFNPKNIHILGNKSDIEGFKKFVKKEENLPVDSSNYITNKDKIIWGHPGIGKTFLRESRNDIIDFDTDYKSKINTKYNLEKGYKPLNKWRETNSELWNKEIRDLWKQAVLESKETNKTLVVSDMIILREFEKDLDKVVTISKETFIKRAKQRNDYFENTTENWKNNIDKTIKENIDKSKIILTSDYFSDLFKKEQTVVDSSNYNFNLPCITNK